MNLNNLKPAEGSTHKSKRIGRGAGSGKGGTATRGNKGAKARSGYHQKVGFEGGQMPLYRRVPKFGFKNMNRIEYVGINIDTLNALAEAKNITEFTLDVFKQNGLISAKDRIKILGRGELSKTLNVSAHAFSATAKKAIEDGSLQVFDTDTFTVGGEKVTTCFALDMDGDFTADTEEAVFDGAFHEHYFQSAPYFALRIDGIELVNEAY